jgi:hypothetical protein
VIKIQIRPSAHVLPTELFVKLPAHRESAYPALQTKNNKKAQQPNSVFSPLRAHSVADWLQICEIGAHVKMIGYAIRTLGYICVGVGAGNFFHRITAAEALGYLRGLDCQSDKLSGHSRGLAAINTYQWEIKESGGPASERVSERTNGPGVD